ncbi:MAG: CDP-archaeol synthase [Bacteroidetes bacterium]|nr:CDP-archaeol synthase [Bacteroidota bacterium]
MNNLIVRTISGIVYTGVIIACVLSGTWMAFSLFFTLNLIALIEFSDLMFKEKPLQNKILLISSGIVIFSVLSLWQFVFVPSKIFSVLLIIPILPFIIELFNKNTKPFDTIGKHLTGLIYISVSLSLFFGLGYKRLILKDGTLVYNGILVLTVFLLVWANDTFAYIIGRWKGKRPLLSRISPKKTIEGSIGGIILTIAVSIGLYFGFKQFYIYHYIILGFIISISSIVGDLVESMLKRSLNVKDSGNIIPGHGGILDRIDASLVTAWIVYIFFQLI